MRTFKNCFLVLLCMIVVFSASPICMAEEENIVLGMQYTFETSEPTTHSYSRYSEGGRTFDRDRGQLTDGRKAKNDPHDNAWLESFRSGTRYVTFDFEKEVTVTSVKANFWHGNGYYAPRFFKLFLSYDGENWFLAGTDTPPFALNGGSRPYNAKIETEPYKTRYVRVEFPVDIFTLCDEIEVFGSRTVSASALTFTPEKKEEPFFCESIENDPYGITDIIKIYNGYYPSNQEKVKNSESELLPYVAYLAENGDILDTMFDAVAFVPCVSSDFAYPSGGTLVRTGKLPSAIKSDWEFYADFLFEEGYELDALDKAVGKVYGQLGIEKKFPVLLTMHYVGVANTPFGDINGDGVDENRKTNEERAAIVKWYNDYLTKRFAEQEYENLVFLGYYWYSEEVNCTWSEDEFGFVKLANEQLQKAGKICIYDPFFLSTGYADWEELGFSGAVMQPNLAQLEHRSYYEPEMLYEFAETIANRHLGVEIETNEPNNFKGEKAALNARVYEKYLYVGAKTGYMNAIHTFYQGAGPGSLYNFCHSEAKTTDGRRLRRLYDVTYDFIKGKYKNEPPTFALESETVSTPQGEKCRIKLNLSDPDSLYGDLSVTVTGAEHGKANVTADKRTLVYVPDEAFSGTEQLSITVSDGQNPEQTLLLTIEVGSSQPQETSEQTSQIDPGTEENPPVLLFVILGVVVVLLALITFFLYKRKKASTLK